MAQAPSTRTKSSNSDRIRFERCLAQSPRSMKIGLSYRQEHWCKKIAENARACRRLAVWRRSLSIRLGPRCITAARCVPCRLELRYEARHSSPQREAPACCRTRSSPLRLEHCDNRRLGCLLCLDVCSSVCMRSRIAVSWLPMFACWRVQLDLRVGWSIRRWFGRTSAPTSLRERLERKCFRVR